MNSNEQREAIIIPEKKEKIERIKRKYNNLSMSDDVAKKIATLEVTNDILLAATSLMSIATVINIAIPDAIPFIDEIIMGSISSLLGTATVIVNNKIKDLAASGNAQLKMEEVTTISNQMTQIAHDIANKRNGQAKTQ